MISMKLVDWRRLLALILLLGLAGGCFVHRSKKSVEKQWPAGQVTAVEVSGLNGTVEIEAANTSEIKLQAVIESRGRKRRRDPADDITIQLSGSRLFIGERQRHVRIHFPLIGRQTTINYHLTVPAQTEVKVVNVNGSIDVDGVVAPINLHTVNGSINVTSPGAELVANTVNGRIRAIFQQQFMGARLKTVNGAVDVTVPPNSSIACDISQVNGYFQSDLPVRVDASPGSRESSASLNGGRFTLEVTTVNGGVSLHERGNDGVRPVADLPPPLPPMSSIPAPPPPPVPVVDTPDGN